MGTALVCAGFILLANPVINVFDVIPDALGFLFIFAGLTRLSYFYDRFDSARRLFMWLSVIEAGKIVSMPLVVNASKFESGSLMLMLSLVFSIAEIGLFIPAVIRMFDGYSTAAVKLGTSRVTTKEKKNGKVYDTTVKARNTMIVFMVIRCLSTLLPELTELELYENEGTVSALSRPLTDFKMMFYRFFVIVVLIAAVFYIIALVRFFSGVARDEKMNSAFAEQLSGAKTERKSFFLARRMKNVLLLFVFSVAAMFPLYIDNVNVMIGVLSAGFLIAAGFILKRDAGGALSVILESAAAGILSVASFILQIRYFDEYSTDAIFFVEEAARDYSFLSIIGAAESLFAALATIWFVKVFLSSVPEQQKICGILAENAQYSKAAHDREVFSYVKRKMIASSCLVTLALASRAAYRFIAPDTPVFIVVNVALALIAVVYTAVAAVSVNTALYDSER